MKQATRRQLQRFVVYVVAFCMPMSTAVAIYAAVHFCYQASEAQNQADELAAKFQKCEQVKEQTQRAKQLELNLCGQEIDLHKNEVTSCEARLEHMTSLFQSAVKLYDCSQR